MNNSTFSTGIRSVVYVLVLTSIFAFADARAQSVTYTFDQFSNGQSTPILNAPPDSGSPATFRTSFTSAPTSNGFIINSFFQPNGLIAGNYLFEPSGTNVLTVAFNMAVNLVNLVFATNGPGSLVFTSSSGTITVPSTAQSGGGGFPGGTLNFSSATPFTSFTLMTDNGTQFAIDTLNMRLAPAQGVPEGGSALGMLASAVLLLGWMRSRRAPVPG